MPQRNQKVGKRERLHFTTLNEMTDLGDDPQWLLTSQKKRQDITCLLMEVHNATSKTLFIKLK